MVQLLCHGRVKGPAATDRRTLITSLRGLAGFLIRIKILTVEQSIK